MSTLPITIGPETADDFAIAIERFFFFLLYERTFGSGRLARRSYRIREARMHRLTFV